VRVEGRRGPKVNVVRDLYWLSLDDAKERGACPEPANDNGEDCASRPDSRYIRIVPDPITTALGVYKGLTILGKAKGVLDMFARSNTARLDAERDEMHRQWDVDTHIRLAADITESREKFLLLGGTLDDHQRLLEELFDKHETELLAALYADDAYREVVAERRRMLSFAAASIVNLHLTIEAKARVEKTLRALDPIDVLRERDREGRNRHRTGIRQPLH
jgi:hypothetical protein